MNSNYSIFPAQPNTGLEHGSGLLTSVAMFASPRDVAFFLSPPAASKAGVGSGADLDCDPDSENKENVSPYRDTTCSERTPSKPAMGPHVYPWQSGERAPLSDISQHFCRRRKKVEATGSAHLPQKALHFTPQSDTLSPPEKSGGDSGIKSNLSTFKAFR